MRRKPLPPPPPFDGRRYQIVDTHGLDAVERFAGYGSTAAALAVLLNVHDRGRYVVVDRHKEREVA